MKREEEIEKQGTIYSDISGNYIEWGDGWQDYNDQVYVEKAFIEGAKWADETMLKKSHEWVKNAFTGVFGEGLANSIADEFVKSMKGE